MEAILCNPVFQALLIIDMVVIPFALILKAVKSFEGIEGVYRVEFKDNSAKDGIYPGEKYPNGYYTQMEKFEEEQKPVEIQKENADMNCITSPKELICSILKGVRNGYYEEEYVDGFEKTSKKILELAKEELKGGTQKPAEWSGEDSSYYDDICEILLNLLYSDKGNVNKDAIEKDLSWFINCFKSLRPQYHGDVTMTEAYKMGKEAGEASHWKPSEEQMEAFKKYIEESQARAEAAVGGWNNFDVMIRLYEQLKKL